MKIKLTEISNTRSGDKGKNSNVGIIFKNKTYGLKFMRTDKIQNIHNSDKTIFNTISETTHKICYK